MEDVAFSRALKRRGRIACLRARVDTSSRRWLRDGPVRTILLHVVAAAPLLLRRRPGALRRRYADTR